MVLEDIEVEGGGIFLTLKIIFLQFSEFSPQHTSDNDILRGK